MLHLEEIIRQMNANAQAMRALLQTIPNEQSLWQPGPDVWSLRQVMEHVYNEERIDFRLLLKEIWGAPALSENYLPVESFQQGLADFLSEREASLAWLRSLEAPDWDVKKTFQFGPDGTLTVSAGEMLVSWLEHDFLHLRQMNELLHAWNVKQAAPYSVQYAGGWS